MTDKVNREEPFVAAAIIVVAATRAKNNRRAIWHVLRFADAVRMMSELIGPIVIREGDGEEVRTIGVEVAVAVELVEELSDDLDLTCVSLAER
ncbi:hypothetical protein [Ferrimicrobium acidiphilum]|uniref:hypothetical protein n=1 Tax=Ferrimicrobium acidiphilum TaxID=121039 RepID=UPI0023F29D68|nr:hypothetical protein [Ferrimicrobium acidiphilum]